MSRERCRHSLALGKRGCYGLGIKTILSSEPKRIAILAALSLSLVAPVLFTGCTPPGPRALLQGERLISEGRYREAVSKLQVAAELLATDARAWNYLGLAHQGAGEPAEAIRAYQQALNLNRNLAAARYNLGTLYLDQGNPAAAVPEFTTYTVLQPDRPEGWLKLGTAQMRLRQFDAAEKSFQSALRLNPKSVEAYNNLGVIQLQRKRPREAAQQFTIALQHEPKYAPALLNLAVVAHQHLNNAPLALQKYREYAALQPPPPHAIAAVNAAKQIDLQLNPPPAPKPVATNTAVAVVTNPPPTVPQPAPQTNVAATVVTPAPVTPAPTNQLTAVRTNLPAPVVKQPVVTNPPPTTVAVAPPATKVEPKTTPPPVTQTTPKVEPPAETAPPLEVVTLAEDAPVQLARDVTPGTKAVTPLPPPTTNTTPVVQPAPAPREVAVVEEEKPGFFSRMNPANWFRSREKGATPLETDTETIVVKTNRIVTPINTPPAQTTPPPVRQSESSTPLPAAPNYARYAYRSPAKPNAGDRAKAIAAFGNGARAYEAGNWAEAVAQYRQAVSADPSYFDAHYNLAISAGRAGDLPLSLTAYEHALAVDANSLGARFNFALALDQAGHPRDAVNELEKLLTAHPNEARAHFFAANLYLQKLMLAEPAKQHYRKALELEPNHPQAPAIRQWLVNNP